MPLVQEGQWFNGSIFTMWDVQFLKFTVPFDPTRPCPILTIELQQHMGTLSTFISTTGIPTVNNFDFSKRFTEEATISICPSHPLFVYGNYYVLISNQGARAANMFSFRYTLQHSPTCPRASASTLPAMSYPASITPPIWLEDGIMQTLRVPDQLNASNPYAFLAMAAPTRCAFFNIGAYKSRAEATRIRLYGSTLTPNPGLFNFSAIEYFAVHSADNRFDIHLCNPDSSANYVVFYVGAFVPSFPYPTDAIQVVGTLQRYGPNVPFSSFAYAQSRLDTAFGAIPQLSCDKAVYTCSYIAFNNCLRQGVRCCVDFWPTPPEAHPQTYILTYS